MAEVTRAQVLEWIPERYRVDADIVINRALGDGTYMCRDFGAPLIVRIGRVAADQLQTLKSVLNNPRLLLHGRPALTHPPKPTQT